MLLFTFPCHLKAELNEDKDVQFWAWQSYFKKINEKTRVQFAYEARFGDDASILYLGYLQALIERKLSKHIFVNAGYRQFWVKPINSISFNPIYGPIADIIYKRSNGTMRIIDRNRFEYLMIDGGPTVWVYRNRVEITADKPWAKIYRPFIFDEIFFREGQGFSQNRLALGLKITFPLEQQTKLFYMLRHVDVRNQWLRHHVLGAYLNFTF